MKTSVESWNERNTTQQYHSYLPIDLWTPDNDGKLQLFNKQRISYVTTEHRAHQIETSSFNGSSCAVVQ